MSNTINTPNKLLTDLAYTWTEGIPRQPTHSILDASKLKVYQTCPRQFFFEYILGWRPDRANIHLIFGEAWHDALEHILLNDYEGNSLYDAYQLFLTKFRESFPDPEQDELWFPKVPERAFQALAAYAGTYPNDLKDYEVLATEIAGTVTVTKELVMTFRMDAILRNRHNGMIFGQEHKTGSRLDPNWARQWHLDYQPLLYLHALKCHYGMDKANEVQINGTFFTNNKGTRGGKLFDFHREPIRKTTDQMATWFTELNVWLQQLIQDYEALGEVGQDDTILNCFVKNPQSCAKYFGCVYHDFCVAWTTPLQHGSEPPVGFRVDHWNPMARAAKKTITV